jgi:hypothetical protein
MKLITTIFIIQFSLLSSFGQKSDSIQKRTFVRDTSYIQNRTSNLAKKIGLPDISKTTSDFYFRFWNQGQAVDLWRTQSDSMTGSITNYIFHQTGKKNIKRDTIFHKSTVGYSLAQNAYDLILTSPILSIPSDDQITGWRKGFDGITYIFEYLDKNRYTYKTYWTPSFQDSLNEALIVNRFIKAFNDTLKLKQARESFNNSLPHKGCYTSGISMTCYVANSFGIGYKANIKMPYGYFVSFYKGYINKSNIDMYGILRHKFDLNGNYDFSLGLGKGIFLARRNQMHSNSLFFNYRQRKITFISPDLTYKNYQINFWDNYTNIINYTLGLDCLNSITDNKIGALIGVSKYFSKPKLTLTGHTLVYSNHFDYNLDITKAIYFRSNDLINTMNFGLNFEKFLNYKDLGMTMAIYF